MWDGNVGRFDLRAARRRLPVSRLSEPYPFISRRYVGWRYEVTDRMSGWWVATFPPDDHRPDEPLIEALKEHELVVSVKVNPPECMPNHIYALCKDPGGPVRMMDALLDTSEQWELGGGRAVWGFADDTSMKGDAVLYEFNDDLHEIDQYTEREQFWQGRRAGAYMVAHYGIDAVVDWWHRFD